MKKHIYTILISLLWLLPATVMADGVVQGTVTLNGKTIVAEYYISGSSAHLGSGYNTCIPQYSDGKVVVPASITANNRTYPVTEVSAMAFRMCTQITSVVLPVGVTRVGDFAFQGCQELFEVSLPSTLTTIGTGAFIDLPRLDKIEVHATTPPTWEYNDVFRFHSDGISDSHIYIYDNVQLFVPEGYISTYRHSFFTNSAISWYTADGWGRFTNIFAAIDENSESYAEYKDGTLSFYYDGNRSLRTGSTYSLNTEDDFPGWTNTNNGHSNDITRVVFSPSFSIARPVSTSRWFYNCVNLDTIIGWEYLITDDVYDMSYMFYRCSRLTDGDLDMMSLVTTNVEDMSSMFQGCSGLTRLDLSHFDTHNCESFGYMFHGCTKLTFIDLSSFVTHVCDDFNSMFYGCSSLKAVDVASFDMRNTSYSGAMFYGCSKLKTLVIPVSISNANNMFTGCTGMEDVYCYAYEPFRQWSDVIYAFAPNKATRFHVWAAVYDDWQQKWGVDSDYGQIGRDPVTFVGDLGTADNPILLYGIADWENLIEMTYEDVAIHARMMKSFNVSTMLGTYYSPFMGTFDGNGCTLNVNYTFNTTDSGDPNNPSPAPFHFIRNATIKNLHVTGAIRATQSRTSPGGLVGYCLNGLSNGVAYNTITNCHVSVEINGKFTSFGGIIGAMMDRVNNTVSGCLFDGRIIASNATKAGAITCMASTSDLSELEVTDCVERGYYENISPLYFCATQNGNSSYFYPVNSYHFQQSMNGLAKPGLSITTETEGLEFDFGTPTAVYDVSGIQAYELGVMVDQVFYSSSGKTIPIAFSASGYEYDLYSFSSTGGAQVYVISPTLIQVVLASANTVINLPMVFTTIVLEDESDQNTFKLENYVDQTHDVQLLEHRLYKSPRWNTLCLPFDLPNLSGTPLEGATMKVLDTITFQNKVAVFRFKNASSISADKVYLVKIGNTVTSPTFSDVTIKRTLPPGLKIEDNENSQKGFSVIGNYNYLDSNDVNDDAESCTALYLDMNELKTAQPNTTLNAFQFFFKIMGMRADEVAACVIDIENDNNIITDFGANYDNIFISDGSWNVGSNWSTGEVPSSSSSNLLIEGKARIPANYVAVAGNITLDNGTITIEDGGQLFHCNNGVVATMKKHISAYNGKGGYYFLAHPMTTPLNPEAIGMTANHYDLYAFDQSQPLEWRNYKQNNFNLTNGIGYLYANDTDTKLSFSGELHPANNHIYVPLTYDADARFAGFNLVGNPFACNAYLVDGRSFYTLNAAGNEVIVSQSDVIAPMQGIFVQADNNEKTLRFATITYTKNKVITMSLKRNGASGSKANTAAIDKACIHFGEGRNLKKFQLDPSHSKIYIPQEGKHYAVVSAEQKGELPFNFKAEENGSYTLTVDLDGVEMNYLHLIDNKTGADVDLLAPEITEPLEGQKSDVGISTTYTFTAKTTDYESRFRLVFSANEDTDGDNNGNDEEPFAYYADGEIRMIMETQDFASLQVLDLMGRVVISVGGHTRAVPTTGMAPGVYVLRLMNGNNIRTQKIVLSQP